jgi:hypothetical protein
VTMDLNKDKVLSAICTLGLLIQSDWLTPDRSNVRGDGVLGILGSACFVYRGARNTYALNVTDDAGDLRVSIYETFPKGIPALQVHRWSGTLGKTADFVA